MKPEDLLEALLDYGIFSDELFGELVGGISYKDFVAKWGLNEAELLAELKQFQAMKDIIE